MDRLINNALILLLPYRITFKGVEKDEKKGM